MLDNKEKLNRIIDKYKLSDDEKKEFRNIINSIFEHNEFQRRMTNEFLHHSNITLGEHILEDAVLTYKMCKKRNNVNIELAVKIAMLHDLYTNPWQNNKKNKVKNFCNKHGFRHPIEAVINANVWFPELFKNKEESKIIIDGILHHMYPLPVRTFIDSDINKMELKNFDLIDKLSDQSKKIIIESLNRKKVKNYSVSKSKYKEGKIMSKADKKVSRGQIKNISSLTSLVTGHNKSLKKK